MTRGSARRLIGFGASGAIGLATQLAVFNVLIDAGTGRLSANAVAVVSSVVVAYLGNRYLAFVDTRGGSVARQVAAFASINAVTFVVSEAALALTYLPGVRNDTLVLNSMTIVGVAIGTVIRYCGYRRFVFTGVTHDRHEPGADPVRPPVLVGGG